MKKKKILGISVIILLVLGIGTGLTLYFTIGNKNPIAATEPKKIDLSKEKIEYLAHVTYMDAISETEANTIKNDIKSLIKTKMATLKLAENVDYTISNVLDKLKPGDHLNNILHQITVNSVKTSSKVEGDLIVTLNVQEDISNRSVEIKIAANDLDENDGLKATSAQSIQNLIKIFVQEVVTKGQTNIETIDYQYINFASIKAGAKFEEYYNQVKVQGISNKLTGEFLITFIKPVKNHY